MDVFIVRPFGTKEVLKRDKSTGQSTTVSFDFEKVEAELICPALTAVNLIGGTTCKIFEAGDIREDMFSLLLMADVVIADISIHNANAFYELGIRHAFRDQKTILIKCPGFDETPFDILGYKYVSYTKDEPKKALPALIQTIQDTLLANRMDSPVYKVLPWLKTTNTEQYLIVPEDFCQEADFYIDTAQADRLALLTEEVRGFVWEVPALRRIGEGQFQLKAFEQAKQTWEQIRKRKPDDLGANDRLSTIYSRLAEAATSREQRLEFLALSDQACNKLLENVYTFDPAKNAEYYSLRARNAKSKWIACWIDKQDDSERRIAALNSPFLKFAFEDYERGFNEDLNHFYSGSSALGFLSILITLAEASSDSWEMGYSSPAKAQQALLEYKERHAELGVVVKASLDAAQTRLKQAGKTDFWIAITQADVNCILQKRPERVSFLYKQALDLLDTSKRNFNSDSARRQLLLYQQLAIVPDNVKAALAQFPEVTVEPIIAKTHYLLFTGHMIDEKGREDKTGNPAPRFPAEKEASARQAIRHYVEQEKKVQEKNKINLIGLAGGACGGDILFHEVCRELGIPTQLLLALPRDQFLQESVQFAGPDWVDRFDRIYVTSDTALPVEKLADSKTLPNWLKKKANYSFWERNNLWMLHKALANGGQYMTLIALWDGKAGDASGGTEHMVNQAKARGAKTVVIDVNGLE